MRKRILAIAVAALALAVYAGVRHLARQPRQSSPGVALPDLVLSDLEGKAIRTSDYKGRVVLVNFWAAWCKPCAEEIPQFMAIEEKYRSRGVQVIGISIDDTDAELRAFYRNHNMNYPVIPGDQKTVDAFGGVLGLPTTFVVGRDSRIHVRQAGSTDFRTLEQQVLSLLQE
jgi:cytochrome c biogenesis protein CcmG, thiol:disulfide interchange protein DsbE